MQLIVDPLGVTRCIYTEAIELDRLGQTQIRRASHVEPDGQGQWWANLAPVHGPMLGPFDRRSAALAAEREWLEINLHRAVFADSRGETPCPA